MAGCEGTRSLGLAEEEIMDSHSPEALGRKPDYQANRESDLPERKLSVQEAARFLGLSASNLNKRRVTGGGPRFCKLGRRVVYDIRNLEEWAAERKRQSTSE
jgi:predicted DNA-binding transcriptional regulator AlpA